jgi:predicted branched-subunit amino acid permease
MKDNYEAIKKENRIDFWIGIGTATWSVAIIATVVGYFASDFLNKDILIGLAIVNPVYFICMMVGAMKTIQISLSVILGAILGPIFYFVSPEWCILFGGFIAGTVAYLFGEFKNVK